MCMCVCRGEAFLVLLLKCCCCCSIINYFHIMPVEQWKYNMCDVAPRPGHSRQSWGGDGGDTSHREQHPGRGPHCPPRTCPAQPWPGTLGQRRSGCSQHFIMVPAPPWNLAFLCLNKFFTDFNIYTVVLCLRSYIMGKCSGAGGWW